jgi:hypothetical protein
MAPAVKTKMTSEIDPTTFSVVWNKFDYIVEQIGQKILYSTQSFVTACVRDLGQTLLDAKGQIVSQHLPAGAYHGRRRGGQGLESISMASMNPGTSSSRISYIARGTFPIGTS